MLIKKRIPFLYVEFAKLKVKNKKLISEHHDEELEINAKQYACIVVGKGCSITSDAVKYISDNYTMLIFSGYKMSTVTMYSNHKNGGRLKCNQYLRLNNQRTRLSIAKKFIKYKNKELPSFLPKMRYKLPDINKIMLQEAYWTKDAYRRCARHNGQIWLGRKEALKSRHKMFLVNTLLYSLALIAITGLGLDPGRGIFHSQRSNNALAFDLADIFKPTISWKNTIGREYNEQVIWGEINEKLVLKKMINILEKTFS